MSNLKTIMCISVVLAAVTSSAFAASVTRSSDGWVSVDGRTIGRVTFSYGEYRISCKRGYNSGWASKSAFGSSFTIKADSKDEATSVLLQACKR